MKKLFSLHDLQGCGRVSPEDLVQLNKRIASLHYGPSVDEEAVRKKYEALFYQHLDPNGRPIPYSVFRDYMAFVLHEHDDDLLAQTMILEQFIVEAESALAIFPLDASPTASTAADDASLCFDMDEEYKGELPAAAAAELKSEASEPPHTNHAEPREDVPDELPVGGASEIEAFGVVASSQRPSTVPSLAPIAPVTAATRPVTPRQQSRIVPTMTPVERSPSVRPVVRLQASERFLPPRPVAAPRAARHGGSLSIPSYAASQSGEARHAWQAQTMPSPRSALHGQANGCSLAAAYGMRPSSQAVLTAAQYSGAPQGVEAPGPAGMVFRTRTPCR